jgi:hypothetical protein
VVPQFHGTKRTHENCGFKWSPTGWGLWIPHANAGLIDMHSVLDGHFRALFHTPVQGKAYAKSCLT